ncbi:MAG: YiiX/YebB-like N1pC/P60 family cysteine hydrolase [candidate division KSB1 bacterium]|nr:YiiX/YebB-like N1pC/P60 family cysteine hydrolase [candidate division KSB1 bacterium]MDZ7274733.1 YiiX/YebB-like N1pC/P60 family cysteine hydrolase [candidate division KSB1 bacterium]MDZ7285558.1 YiiX/YebB-like N1pC/P60 family cysteine hydrolase [candidate division KSB1 bacterium]MDZ7298590.1 YiiX/YebB-like N1pC/P60 family cysteine hydrolase [candidate division KSB1 bacterium]MDZ7306769.1 YiiX/YebB-like N1pC/P60 family cysteine hydrolase [candidate division KSB1 bacterium]
MPDDKPAPRRCAVAGQSTTVGQSQGLHAPGCCRRGKTRQRRRPGLLPGALVLMLLLPGSDLHAQPTWPAAARQLLPVLQAVSDSTNRLLHEIGVWQAQGGQLRGAQQARWALLLAGLNQGYQHLLTFSDDWEFARRLPPSQFASRFDTAAARTPSRALLVHTGMLRLLLAADRALYAMIDTLRRSIGSSLALQQRLNEGNRAFGLQYGIFESMTAAYFDASRQRRTRSRWRQLHHRRRTAGRILQDGDPALLAELEALLADPRLLQIARQNEIAARAAATWAAVAALRAPSADLASRTLHNASQFFGNLVGTTLFRLASLAGIGEWRGHALPAMHRYYPSPDQPAAAVHPGKVEELAAALQAGDILFEKTRFAITDKLIPGYFGHVAIYLESYEALRALGIFETAELQQALNGMPLVEIEAKLDDCAAALQHLADKPEWLQLAALRRRLAGESYQGRPLNPLLFEALYRLRDRHGNVIEALRDGQTLAPHTGGVTLNRFEDFLHVDDLAAVRLRPEQRTRHTLARFLALALLQYGKPYDFRFDVNTLDAIVCSELIYHSFVEVNFATETSLGSRTISPDHVAQQAGVATTLAGQRLQPPFALQQWLVQAMPFYPLPAAHARSDSLVQRAFMAHVREQQGGLQLLSDRERREWTALQDSAARWRARESERLRRLPVPATVRWQPPAEGRAVQRRRVNFYIALAEELAHARAAGASAAGLAARQTRALLQYARRDSAGLAPAEMARLLADDFASWQAGAAYRPDYLNLLGGPARLALAVFGAATLQQDQAFGRGIGLRLAGNHEAPRVGLGFTQHYTFLPVELLLFDDRGRERQRWQGGASLARLQKNYTHGGHLALQALHWHKSAYATTFVPFALAAGGDKGPLTTALHLVRLGNGHYRGGLYLGEMMRVELGAWDFYHGRRAGALVNFHYGARLQCTLGAFRAFAEGSLGERLGELAARRTGRSAAWPEMRDWRFGLELTGSNLYRPTRHRLTFSVREDHALFRRGRVHSERRVRVQYEWSLND